MLDDQLSRENVTNVIYQVSTGLMETSFLGDPDNFLEF